MSDYTFEFGQANLKYETFEWDNLWIDYANNTEKKRVLYIGDSISGAVRKVLSNMCEERILFDGFATSKGLDNPYLKEAISLFAKQLPKNDIVLFNNGLHGWHLDDEEYRICYDKMIEFLMEQFRDSKIYILLTTYVSNPDCKDRVQNRNSVAKELAQKYNLPVIDLYSLTEKNKELISEDKIHQTVAGNELIAAEILDAISETADTEDEKKTLAGDWNENAEYLEKRCLRVIDAITREVDTEFDGIKKCENVLLPTFDKYPSIWLRDVAMNMECRLIDLDLIKKHILYFAKYGQNGAEDLQLKNKLVVPAWTMTDHLNYNGKPVYFPGTYADGDDQGAGQFGFYPSMDDNYYFVHMVYGYIKQSGDSDILDEVCSGMTVLERLEKAWEGYCIDEETDLCYSHLPYYSVDWGFTDSIVKSGLLLFSSLLRYQTATELSEIYSCQGNVEKAKYYSDRASRVRNSVVKTFWDGSGWLYSATELCHQYDVWGTVYAVYIGILPEALEIHAAKTVAKEYRDGHISVHGYLRMIRTVDDDKFGQSWECPNIGNRMTIPQYYQNGGYWASASGWLFYTLAKADLKLAGECVDAFVEHTKKYAEEGAPFEFINRDSSYFEGKLAGTSATLPYIGVKRIIEENLY